MSTFACSAPVAERVRRRGGRAVVGGAVLGVPWWARRGGRAVVGAHMWRLSMPSPRCMCPIPKYRLHCDRPGERTPS